MSCRTTPAGSAFTTYARLGAGSDISDVATLSAFHALRRDYQDTIANSPWRARMFENQITPEAYRQALAQMTARVEADDTLSDARRASLMDRLRAATTADIPDASTIYALRNIAESIRTQADARLAFLREYAANTGTTLDEATARWNALENGIDRTRGAADPESITDAIREEARRANISRESGSLHAYATMNAESLAAELDTLRAAPPRFTPTPIQHTEAMVIDGQPLRVIAGGYDPRSGYAQVTVRNEDTGEETVHHYRQVNATVWNQVNSLTATESWNRHMRGSYWNNLRDERDALRAGAAPRCGLCGQFSDVHHSCPVSASQQIASFRMTGSNATGNSYQKIPVTWTDANGNSHTSEMRVSLPLVNDFRTAGRSGAILMENVREHMYFGYGYQNSNLRDGIVEGQMGVMRDENGQTVYQTSGLTCSCVDFRANGTCIHVTKYVEAVRARLNPPARTPAAALTPEQRAERVSAAQARAEAAAAADWTRDQATLEEARRTWRRESDVVYSEDYDAFAATLAAATEQVAAKNGAAVPYMRENALGGMATRGSGQAFGMEIEYEFPPGTNTAEANARIGAALKALNLTDHDTQQGYHSATQAGFRDYHVDPATGKGTWSWERDGSVNGGELVTPAMYDEPETWDKLAQAVQVLKDNGAVATVRAGAHVHVGTGFFGGDVKKYGELAKAMSQHEDIMFRLAQNPERGEHRQGNYTAPLAETPSGGWRDISHLRQWQGGRTRALNLTHVAVPVDQANIDAGFAPSNESRSAKDHPEFRIYDSTLDVGIMQTQIKLSVALTHAAARNADLGGTTRGKEEIGAHAERIRLRGRRRPTEDDIKDETATFRSFIDTLFTRKEDKDQVIALFAATKWNKPDRGNKRHVDTIRAQRAQRQAAAN